MEDTGNNRKHQRKALQCKITLYLRDALDGFYVFEKDKQHAAHAAGKAHAHLLTPGNAAEGQAAHAFAALDLTVIHGLRNN